MNKPANDFANVAPGHGVKAINNHPNGNNPHSLGPSSIKMDIFVPSQVYSWLLPDNRDVCEMDSSAIAHNTVCSGDCRGKVALWGCEIF